MTIPPRLPSVRGLLAVVLLGAVSCTTVGGVAGTPEPEPVAAPEEQVMEAPEVAGRWTGFLSIDGSNIDATLQVDQDGEDVSMVLEAPGLGLTARGDGRIAPDRTLTIDVRYETQCPGVARLRGALESDGLRMSGPLEVEDCTGGASGAFLFNR